MGDVINRKHAQNIADSLSPKMRKYLAWMAGDIDMIDGWGGLKEHKEALAKQLISVDRDGRFSMITSLGLAVNDLLSASEASERDK